MLSETLTYLYRVVVTQGLGAMVVVTPALEATVEATLAQEVMEVANLGVWAVIPALEAATEGTADLATSLVQVVVSQWSITLHAAQC